jgi:hypothetical protein
MSDPLFKLTDRKIKITPDQLVFFDKADLLVRIFFPGTECDFHLKTHKIHYNVPFGLVCAFEMDRVDPWNLFVIVGETETEFEVICPRIQVNPGQSLDIPKYYNKDYDKVEEIVFGQDNMIEQEYVRNFKFSRDGCTCYFGQGCQIVCECDVSVRKRHAFSKTFLPKTEPEYAIALLKKERIGCHLYTTICKSACMLKMLEIPFIYYDD